MSHYVGLDAAKATTHICILDRNGAVVARDQVETSPKAIIASLRGQGRRYARVGMESWGMANWIYEGLARAGLPIICINAVHAHAYLKAQRNKTDRNDAAGIRRVLLPARNRRDFDDIPEEVRNTLEFVWLQKVEDAVAQGLQSAQ